MNGKDTSKLIRKANRALILEAKMRTSRYARNQKRYTRKVKHSKKGEG